MTLSGSITSRRNFSASSGLRLVSPAPRSAAGQLLTLPSRCDGSLPLPDAGEGLAGGCRSLQAGNAQRGAEAVGAVERVAVFAMHRGVVGAGEQQPVAVVALVFQVILDQHLADLLVVRVVAHPRRQQREALDQRAAILVVVEIGAGPVDARLAVERQHRLVDLAEDFGAAELRCAGRGLRQVRLGVVDALLVPGLSLIHISEPTRQAEISYAV